MNASSNETLRMRSEPVPWFGLFFSWITMILGIERPSLAGTAIELIPGDLLSVSAIARGEAELGMTTPPACATMAYRGVGPYPEELKNIRAILNFPHDDRLVWAATAESGVTSIEEMCDRPLTIAVGGKDSPVGFAFEKVLEAYGISLEQQIASNWNVMTEDYLFKVVSLGIQGKADVVIHEGRKTPPWARLVGSREMRFLGIRDDVIEHMEREYGFRGAVLSAGMIDGAVKADLPTLDWSDWLLFTRDDVAEDLVHQVTKIVVEYHHLFEMAFKGQDLEHSDLVYPMDPKKIWHNAGVPLHPGAERYFRENGYMT